MSFIDDVHRDLIRLLTNFASRATKLKATSRHMLARTLTTEISSRRTGTLLEQFLVEVLSLPLEEQTAADLLNALIISPSLAFVAWQKLSLVADTLSADSAKDCALIRFLLRPIPSFLTESTISQVLAIPIESWHDACDEGEAPLDLADLIQHIRHPGSDEAAERIERSDRSNVRMVKAWAGLDGVNRESGSNPFSAMVTSLERKS